MASFPPEKKRIRKDFSQNIKLIQTPQGFKFKTIFEAHKKALIKNARDDSSLLTEKKMNFVKGEKFNYKKHLPKEVVKLLDTGIYA